jgi:hypothetical protein
MTGMEQFAKRSFTVVVIGGGPSGLALGHALQRRGIDFVILEKGDVGHSWSRMPKHLKLISPWKWNCLTASCRECFAANAQLSRADFLDYLRDFSSSHRLPVVTDCAVLSVEHDGQSFHVETSRGIFISRMLVNATGYFSTPITPFVEGQASTAIPRLHYAEFRNAGHIINKAGSQGLILVVGKRLSAGQTALELFDHGLRVAISHRTPVRFGVDDWLWPFVYRTFGYAELLRLKFMRDGGSKLDVRMPGGRVRHLIESGQIRCFPSIARFERDTVVFENGATAKPDVVLHATGFAPTLAHLKGLALDLCPENGLPLTHDMESVNVPNLFFLGFEMLRNFRSRFLRGLRDDALVLADQIHKRAEQLPSRCEPAPAQEVEPV